MMHLSSLIMIRCREDFKRLHQHVRIAKFKFFLAKVYKSAYLFLSHHLFQNSIFLMACDGDVFKERQAVEILVWLAATKMLSKMSSF